MSNGILEWHLRDALNGGPAHHTFQYGQDGDCPVVGNWDGAGGDGVGVVRNEGGVLKWYLRNAPQRRPAQPPRELRLADVDTGRV